MSGDDDKHLETYTTIPIGLAERVVRKAARFEGTTQFRGVLPPKVASRWREVRRRARVWGRVNTQFPPWEVPVLAGAAAQLRRENCFTSVPASKVWLAAPSDHPSPTNVELANGAVPPAWTWQLGARSRSRGVEVGVWEDVVARAYWEAVMKNGKWLIQEAGAAEAVETTQQAAPGIVRAAALLDAAWFAGARTAHDASVLKDIGLCYYTLATQDLRDDAFAFVLKTPVPPRDGHGTVDPAVWRAWALERVVDVWTRFVRATRHVQSSTWRFGLTASIAGT